MKKLFLWAIVVGIVIGVLCFFRGCFNPLPCDTTLTPPPVSISFRESLMMGYVLQVHSLRNEPIECRMSVYNDTHNQARENIQFVLQPGEMKEFGLLELGWLFVPGEHGWVSVSGYLMKLNFELKNGGGWKVW